MANRDPYDAYSIQRRRRGRRLVKYVFLFYFGISFAFIWNYPVSLSVSTLALLNMLRTRSIPNRNTKN